MKRSSSSGSQQTLSLFKKSSYTVSEVTALLSDAIEQNPSIGGMIVIQGELSNVKRSSRGHLYFTLKDATASIGGILWASTVSRLAFQPEEGMEIFLTGKIEIYRPSGTYSIVAQSIEPVGIGALQLAFQQIKARLAAEGLFEQIYKKELPSFPERVGLVTSSTGAVIHDMLRVIRRKNPLMHIILAPVKVQGEGAASEIAQAIRELNHPHYRLDALIVARGGGSFEDLFCFSEEAVVRAIFESVLPIVTGIGHEPDYSLADATADYSAATPTAAADWITPDLEWLQENCRAQAHALLDHMDSLLSEEEQTLDRQATKLIERHQARLVEFQHQSTQSRDRLLVAGERILQSQEQSFLKSAAALDAYSPLAALKRGYAFVTDSHQKVVQSVNQAKTGEQIHVRLSDGSITCQVV